MSSFVSGFFSIMQTDLICSLLLVPMPFAGICFVLKVFHTSGVSK